ncbi:MAG TPA: tyrosine--tRNA ligase [Longimicrobiales bacterium]|nr:tyrosine--tRNA ligase [Longimicrobiales bacterium]
MDLIEELTWRGLLYDATDGAREHLAERAAAGDPVAGYIGFDPSASSLHVGSLVPVMLLVHLQRAGHVPVALVGGGTGLIGDPSGKEKERTLLTVEEARANAEAIRAQLERFLDFSAGPASARLRNNLDWLGEVRFVDFLRDIGKHFSVNAMIRKESVRRRLERDEAGISYTEFSYMLLQAYDYLMLHDIEGCTLQMGGSDQWGNIVAGVDLVRRERGVSAHGIVAPLVTTGSGVKFGKTEAGAVWLDAERTSPYRFYQFWLNVEDADAGTYLRFFTLKPRDEIEALEAELGEKPEARAAQRALAADVTLRVHGADGLARAERATEVLFGGSLDGLGGADIEDIFADVPSSTIGRASLDGDGLGLVEALADAGVVSSRGEARRALQQGAIYLNNERVAAADRRLVSDDAIDGGFLVLRHGKRRYHLLRVDG